LFKKSFFGYVLLFIFLSTLLYSSDTTTGATSYTDGAATNNSNLTNTNQQQQTPVLQQTTNSTTTADNRQTDTTTPDTRSGATEYSDTTNQPQFEPQQSNTTTTQETAVTTQTAQTNTTPDTRTGSTEYLEPTQQIVQQTETETEQITNIQTTETQTTIILPPNLSDINNPQYAVGNRMINRDDNDPYYIPKQQVSIEVIDDNSNQIVINTTNIETNQTTETQTETTQQTTDDNIQAEIVVDQTQINQQQTTDVTQTEIFTEVTDEQIITVIQQEIINKPIEDPVVEVVIQQSTTNTTQQVENTPIILRQETTTQTHSRINNTETHRTIVFEQQTDDFNLNSYTIDETPLSVNRYSTPSFIPTNENEFSLVNPQIRYNNKGVVTVGTNSGITGQLGDTILTQAVRSFRQQNYPLAKQLFERSIHYNSYIEHSYYYLSRIAYLEKNLGLAIEYMLASYNEGIKNSTNNTELSTRLYQCGVISMESGNFADAIRYLTESIVKDPSLKENYRALGLAYIKNNQRQLAIETLQKAIDMGDQNSLRYLELLNRQ